MKTKTRMIVTGAVASMVMAAAGATASAAGTESDVVLKFNFNQFEFSGNVDSDKGKCVRHRVVKVYKKQDGNDKLIGSDHTDSGGKFHVGGFGSVDGGDPHYAIAEKKVVDGVTCAESKSKKIIPNDFEN